MKSFLTYFFTGLLMMCSVLLIAQNKIEVLANEKHQIIDGFGAFQGDENVNQDWWLDLFYDDMGSSIFRVNLTPKLGSPFADLKYTSPWFMGEGVDHPLNFSDPDNPNGPDGNRVRTYTNVEDYSRDFAGFSAPIAVMGPDIDENVKYFKYSESKAITVGLKKSEELGDFKLYGSIWSPLPWVKVSSGNSWREDWWPGPVNGTKWPFVWGGNFAGGRLDVTDEVKMQFDDSSLGGEGPTSALTQFARSTVAYLRGYQKFHKAKFHAISIQNELNFEEFYDSATYPLTSQYIIAINAIRKEMDKYDDLKDIKIIGPEDLLGGDAYGMWQYGSGNNTIHKNLQYLQKLVFNDEATDALDFFCIHGYDSDGASASGATSKLWDWWVNGWDESPAPGIPSNVNGFAYYGKKSWMTETSGENINWLYPSSGYPGEGAWSLALRIHQALTVGQQSAWIYWSFTDVDPNGNITPEGMTSFALGSNSPKYVAAKHYFKYIRPNSYRVSCNTSGSKDILSSAYVNEKDSTVTMVLLNTSSDNQSTTVQLKGLELGTLGFESYVSSDGDYWKMENVTLQDDVANITLPPYSVVTLYGQNAVSTGVQEIIKNGIVQSFKTYPNPFQKTTSISFELTVKEKVHITLLDTQGRTIDTLMNEVKIPGKHILGFDGMKIPDGVYLCKMQVGNFEEVLKLVKGTK